MRAVAIGGGHGTAVSLRALRRLTPDVTGVVSVADDGGSTGRLRAMLSVPAVGDLRKCLGALADPHNPVAESFEHRFSVGELAGHTVGNLLLVGLIDATGDLEAAIGAVAEVLGVTGRILPATREKVVLCASTAEGSARGQTEVHRQSAIRRVVLDPPYPAAPIAAVEAIERADLVLVGPGSLFTSVLAAAVVPGVTQALAGSRATRVYVANLRPELPETAGYRLQDHVDALDAHGIVPDVVLVDAQSPLGRDPCTLPTVRARLTGRNPYVHRVQDLARAVGRLVTSEGRKAEG